MRPCTVSDLDAIRAAARVGSSATIVVTIRIRRSLRVRLALWIMQVACMLTTWLTTLPFTLEETDDEEPGRC